MTTSSKTIAGELHLTPEEIVQQITTISPTPLEWIPRAVWLCELSSTLKKILAAVESEYKIAVEVIIEDELTDDTYDLIPITKQERMVNTACLRSQLPALYEKCAFIDADTVMKHLGKSRLRQLMIDTLGEEEVLKLDSVNIDVIKDVLGDAGMETYIQTLTVPNGYQLCRKTDAATDVPEAN